MLLNYVFLALATIAEVVSTSALKASQGFTRLWPSVIVIFGYGCTFYCLSLSFRTIPLAVAYAIWCGGGIAMIPLIDWLYFGERLDLPSFLGLLLIFAGVLVLTLYSKSSVH